MSTLAFTRVWTKHKISRTIARTSRIITSAGIRTQAFSEGDPFPKLEANQLRLYSHRFCPFSHRARLVLSHKNIAHEVVNINLKSKPTWFAERNPSGEIPVLEYNERIVYDSTVCSDFLDETYPQDRLTPTDPYLKARQKMSHAAYTKVINSYYKVVYHMEEGDYWEELLLRLKCYEDKVSGKFFGGDNVGMLDLMMWPWIERFSIFKTLAKMELPEERLPKLKSWVDKMYKECSEVVHVRHRRSGWIY